jgi:tetratricopeptide (TPR) repeat protein
VPAVAVTAAVVQPAATVTVAGTVSAAALLESAIAAPPVAAGLVKVTVHVDAADESNFLALENLAGLIVEDNPDEALRFAERAVELAPDDASAHDTLGWVYYRKGVYGSAAEHLKLAVAKEPTPRRQYRLGMCYLKTGDRDRGQQMLASALKQDPKLATEKQQ